LLFREEGTPAMIAFPTACDYRTGFATSPPVPTWIAAITHAASSHARPWVVVVTSSPSSIPLRRNLEAKNVTGPVEFLGGIVSDPQY
jgi:hypothetical protein